MKINHSAFYLGPPGTHQGPLGAPAPPCDHHCCRGYHLIGTFLIDDVSHRTAFYVTHRFAAGKVTGELLVVDTSLEVCQLLFCVAQAEMDDQGCPRCKTTKYRNPSLKLMVNVCGHTL